jgi:aminoglycoside phosphotransferase (APT) family kinase protein
MTTLARRDDAELARGIATWCAHRWPDAKHAVIELTRPSSGWSNETLLVTTSSRTAASERRDRLVVRMPPSVPTWPSYELEAQARVLEALAPTPIPVPHVIAFEPDEHWLGAPFLVMSHEAGRVGGEVPAMEPWIVDAPVDEQRRLHESFATMLAAIHRVDWSRAGLADVVRGGEASTAAEVAWWRHYVDWAADGAPTPALADAIAWCASSIPEPEPAASLCWGDARLGNVLFSDDRVITSVLDWEQATIGSAELDLGWYLVLDQLTTHYTKRSVPGFLDRDTFVATYEAALGRPVRDLEWHELFALTRSVAINERQARLAAVAGVPYPGVAGEANPVLRHLTTRIDRFRQTKFAPRESVVRDQADT